MYDMDLTIPMVQHSLMVPINSNILLSGHTVNPEILVVI